MSWVDSRRPVVPSAFRPHLSDSAATTGDVEELVGAARRHLEETLARPGRDREAAFHLLAADAYATYACEAAMFDDDPAASLRSVLERLQSDED